ncbi:Zinc finger protein 808 [Eumeta japonica]|uniref:Zinc finger protein 808 n=1 Tax=Eumeta variegata TaxID=151549 RepID=A0A4C1WYV6_EUMVA|nr:Zinc finger protein 808 [Eumeta japonica]
MEEVSNMDVDPLSNPDTSQYQRYDNDYHEQNDNRGSSLKNQFFIKSEYCEQSNASTENENENQKANDDTSTEAENQNMSEQNIAQTVTELLSQNFNQTLHDMLPQFPFYGCAVCNISYLTLTDLDRHMAIHKDRITSWDLRQRAKEKKKYKVKRIKKEVEEPVDKQNDESVEQSSEEHSSKEKNADETLEKIFKCGVCYKQFALSYYLKLHVRSHTGEKPYTCAECGMSFITASKLGRHRKLHSMVKAECRICHKTFTRFEYLTKHFDKKHMEDKLEGEPYDYNAILPYLKELEEEMEKQKAEEQSSKPKAEDDWLMNTVPVKEELEVKIKVENIKAEPIDAEMPNSDHESFEVNFEPVKEEESDSDYFPEVSAATKSMETVSSPVKPKQRGRRKKSPVLENENQDREDKKELDFTMEGEVLKCKVCDKIIKTPSYMRIHLRTHTGERPYRCYICEKGFITSSKMHRHVLTHMEAWESGDAEEITVKVEVDWVNGNRNENEHAKENEAKTESNQSEGASQKVSKKKRKFLKKHIKLEKNQENKKRRKRPHACEFCHKRFLHLETLHVHRRMHRGEKQSFVCHFCLTKFEDEENLKIHLISHTGPKPYICTICGKRYKRKDTMIYHRRMHKMEKKFQCNVCNKSFVAPCKLQRHLLSHRPDKYVVRYECPVCAHIFNTKYHIEMHLTTHEKEGVILEENRGEILAMVLQNARKIQVPTKVDAPVPNFKDIMPSDERSRVCNICGEVFHHFFYLEEHLKTHGSKLELGKSEAQSKEDERRYKCTVCQKGFKLHYYLKLHSFTHTKEKPFICQQCGKGFITKGKLKRHLESHSGLKKYQCHICLKFFTRPSYLRIHVRTIHGRNDNSEFRHDIMSIPLASTCLSVLNQD